MPLPRQRDSILASIGSQTCKQAPLVTEYKSIVSHPAGAALPFNAVLLPPLPTGGDLVEGEVMTNIDTSVSTRIGIYRTPAEFVEEAWNIQHPLDTSGPSENIVTAINWMTYSSKELIEVELRKSLLKLQLWAKQLESEEGSLHKSLEAEVAVVVQNKNLLLWKKFLEITKFDDLTVVQEMTEGVKLIGPCPKPDCFKSKIAAAKLDEESLEVRQSGEEEQ